MAGRQKSFWKSALTCGRDFYSWQHQRGPVQRGQLIPGTDKAKWEKHTIPLLIDYYSQMYFWIIGKPNLSIFFFLFCFPEMMLNRLCLTC